MELKQAVQHKVERGEVWIVNLGRNKGCMQSGVRPCIVISNNLANAHSPVINVIPVTSKNKSKNVLPTHVPIGNKDGLNDGSTALAEQVQLVNKSELVRSIGKVSSKILHELEVATLVQIGLVNKIKSITQHGKSQMVACKSF